MIKESGKLQTAKRLRPCELPPQAQLTAVTHVPHYTDTPANRTEASSPESGTDRTVVTELHTSRRNGHIVAGVAELKRRTINPQIRQLNRM